MPVRRRMLRRLQGRRSISLLHKETQKRSRILNRRERRDVRVHLPYPAHSQ